MKVGKRLALGFGTCLVLTMAIAAMAIGGWPRSSGPRTICTEQSNRMLVIKDASVDIANIYLDIWHVVTTKDPESREEYKSALEKTRATYAAKLAQLKDSGNPDTAGSRCRRFRTAVANARDLNVQGRRHGDERRRCESPLRVCRRGLPQKGRRSFRPWPTTAIGSSSR